MPTYLSSKQFSFETTATYTSGTSQVAYAFDVVNFKGTEGISRLYEFDITLVSNKDDVDLKAMLAASAVLHLRPKDTAIPANNLPIHGVLSRFEQRGKVGTNTFYHAHLVPKLWKLTLHNVSEVYLAMTIPEIISNVLVEAGMTKGTDFDITLYKTDQGSSNYTATEPTAGEYRRWEYICQYQESHFNFLSRWMEREGIYYWFDQSNGGKLIITDGKTKQADLPVITERAVNYSPPSALNIGVSGTEITALLCRQAPLPTKVTIQDFNYRLATPVVQGSAIVDPTGGTGELMLYGENVRSDQEAACYATIRAEELKTREKVFFGEGAAPYIRVGWYFNLLNHYRADYNTTVNTTVTPNTYTNRYLLTSLNHVGTQASILLPGMGSQLAEWDSQSFYSNSFEAIPESVQFRPERKTPKSRFYGNISAKVEASGTGEYAVVDVAGRYNVKMPFDRSSTMAQKASGKVRLASPFCGVDEGMHFPLRNDAEVMLTFEDGDPDRPIIAAALPSASDPNVVTETNSTQNVIRTSGYSVIKIDDNASYKQVQLACPETKAHLYLGKYSESRQSDVGGPINEVAGYDMYTDSYGSFRTGKSMIVQVGPTDPVSMFAGGDTALESHSDFASAGTEANLVGKWKISSATNDGSYFMVVDKHYHQLIRGDADIKVNGNYELSTKPSPATFTYSGALGEGGNIFNFSAAAALMIGISVTPINVAVLAAATNFEFKVPAIFNFELKAAIVQMEMSFCKVKLTYSKGKTIDLTSDDASLESEKGNIILTAAQNINCKPGAQFNVDGTGVINLNTSGDVKISSLKDPAAIGRYLSDLATKTAAKVAAQAALAAAQTAVPPVAATVTAKQQALTAAGAALSGLTAPPGGDINLNSPKNINSKSLLATKIEATTDVTITGTTGVKLDGKLSLDLKAAQVNQSGSGMLKIAGGVVSIG